MEANKYASSHMTLLPDKSKATFRNLFKQFIFTRNSISESDLLNHNISDKKENKFLHRGLLFISIFIQILLHNLSKPLKIIRTIVEDFLNFGIAQRDSDKYISFIGHSDTRLDLDKKIKHGDAKYYPALSMMASKLAYENKAVITTAVTKHWKMELLGFYDFYNDMQHKLTTQAFMFREKNNKDDETIVIAFRGTSPFVADDWSTDFDFSWVKIDGMGKSHMGFMIALGLNNYYHEDDDFLGDFSGSWPKKIVQVPEHPLAYYTLRDKLKELIANNKNAKIVVTGHSLGAALAILFPSVLALHGEAELLDRMEGIYTYGQPRVGDAEFGEFMKKNLSKYNIKYFRIVYGYDMVPNVPLDDTMMTFKHFGRCIHYNTFYHGKVVEEEEEKHGNFILRMLKLIVTTIISLVVAKLTGLWELIRGLLIGFVKGREYREGWFLICLRIVGILFPSMINHSPQDYVNSTRLASEDLFKNYLAFS